MLHFLEYSSVGFGLWLGHMSIIDPAVVHKAYHTILVHGRDSTYCKTTNIASNYTWRFSILEYN